MTADGHTLAGTDVRIPAIGVGTWASRRRRATWGMGASDTSLTKDTIEEAWSASIDAGATLFDTAEVYGEGESERIIGSLLRRPGRAAKVVIASKFMPEPWKVNVSVTLLARRGNRWSASAWVRQALPVARADQPAWPRRARRGAGGAHQAGLVKAVGVSNYSMDETRAIDADCASATCGSPPTRSSSRCCGACPRRAGSSPPAPSSVWCRSPTRRSGRAGSPASTRRPTRRRASAPSSRTGWRRSTQWPSSARSARSTAAAPRARWRSTGSSRRARCRSPAPRTRAGGRQRRRARLERRRRRPRRARPGGAHDHRSLAALLAAPLSGAAPPGCRWLRSADRDPSGPDSRIGSAQVRGVLQPVDGRVAVVGGVRRDRQPAVRRRARLPGSSQRSTRLPGRPWSGRPCHHRRSP